MRVSVDFDEKYARETDPWGIGDADSERYRLYGELIRTFCRGDGAILDIGAGFGAFLATLAGDFDHATAVDVSAAAVEEGRRRFPGIEFHQGTADRLQGSPVDDRRFDAIVFSDVIYYLRRRGKQRSLDWIEDHLTPEGIALIAAWCPGGRYLTPEELRALIEPRFAIEEARTLDSGHAVFIVRRRRRLVGITVDYETWQPIPEGRTIDWDRDVFEPTDQLLRVCEQHGAPVTLFAEMGEYLWLMQHEPELARRMAAQWRGAVERGHDVQLHLHPTWLPELGAHRDGTEWTWDESVARAHDYPGDLNELIARCATALEEAIRPATPSYEVTCFRAGAYEAQPFQRLHDALAAIGVGCDSSVYSGGQRADRSYDYSLAWSKHQPYFANRYDPQLKAPPAERSIVELPVFAPRPNERWTFDFAASGGFAGELLDWTRRQKTTPSAESLRLRERVRWAGGLAYGYTRRARRLVNRVLPRRLAHALTSYGSERATADDFFVLIGHTKADLDMEAIGRGLGQVAPQVDFRTMSEMAELARSGLEHSLSGDGAAEARRQVECEREAVLGEQRNSEQSFWLQALIPLDRRRVLDLGCGAGDWSARIAALYPWMQVVGIDAGAEFIARANELHASERVRFAVGDFAALDFPDGSFDCVYADNTLEHAFDVDRTLHEAHRVLSEGGVLVAAIPTDARNPGAVCLNHTWKTAPHEVRARLEAAGFADVTIEEVDTLRRLGMPPYPPSEDRMMYVVAWRRDRPLTARERAEELSDFIYESLEPDRPHPGVDLIELLSAGHAWCAGYAVAAGLLLQNQGYGVTWVTMRGSRPGPDGSPAPDTHEVVEVELPGGSRRVLDAMANIWFDASTQELLRHPEIADRTRPHDQRYVERGYEHFTTSAWYRSVESVAVRADPRDYQRFQPTAELIRSDGLRLPPRWWRLLLRARGRLEADLARSQSH